MYKWAILGTGNMANQMGPAIRGNPFSSLSVVASRDISRANRFAYNHDLKKVHASYVNAIRDTAVDVVYIALPPALHYPVIWECIQNRKAVVCEKPICITNDEFRRVRDEAHRKSIFVMEANFMKCLPSHRKAQELIQQGKIGAPSHLSADFGFSIRHNPNDWRLKAELGGGCLLDIGVYPISLACSLLGKPVGFNVACSRMHHGVDSHVVFCLEFEHGCAASLLASFELDTQQKCAVTGTHGVIMYSEPFWRTRRIEYVNLDGVHNPLESRYVHQTPVQYEANFDGVGYRYVVDEVINVMSRGAIESEICSHWLSSATLLGIDMVRGFVRGL